MKLTLSSFKFGSVALLGLLAFALPRAHADSTDARDNNGELKHGERKFLMKAAEGSTNEVALSRVAVERAQDPQVREFAQRMITDHEALNMKVKDLAGRKNVDISEAVQKGMEKDVDSLRHKSAANFDQAYLDDMVSGHKDVIELFEKAAMDARDMDIATLASETLPTLFEHYRHARHLDHRAERDGARDASGMPAPQPVQ
jgi:putative membrane protein